MAKESVARATDKEIFDSKDENMVEYKYMDETYKTHCLDFIDTCQLSFLPELIKHTKDI